MGDPKSDGKVSSPLIQRPTAVRYGVLAFVTLMSIILYLDRNCMSIAESTIRNDLRLSKEQMGLVFSAFYLAYSLAQVPAGWLGDRLGARLMLVACVVLWSACTMLTGLATGLVTLLVCRLLVGLGEAGGYPVAA